MGIRFGSGSGEIFRFELSSIVDDRRFLLGLILQTFLIALLVPVLIDYSERVSSGSDVLGERARGFAPVAIWGEENPSLQEALGESERVDLIRVSTEEEAKEGLHSGRFCMVVGIMDASGEILVSVNRGDPRSVTALLAVETTLESFDEVLRRRLVEDRLEDSPYNGTETWETFLEPISLRIVTIGRESPNLSVHGLEGPGVSESNPENGGNEGVDGVGASFLSIFFVSFGLCFPLLSGSGMMVESVTGEKERRSMEALLGASIPRSSILLGKLSPVLLISVIQAMALLLILGAIIPIHSMPLVAACLVIVGFTVLSASTLVSVICKGSKEANLAMTILYVLIFVIFFGPVMLPGPMAWMSPLTPLVRLAAGDSVPAGNAIPPLLGSMVLSVVFLSLSIALFRRDDVVFGPRPAFRNLVRDVVSSRAQSFRSRILLVSGMGALATIPAIFFPSLFLLPSYAILGGAGLPVILVLAALVEEYFKPYGVYMISSRLETRELIMLGALAGISFSAVENVLFTYALLGTGYLRGGMLFVRYGVAPMMHVGLTILVVVGYTGGGRRRLLTLAAASVIHALYNLFALMTVM